MYKILIGIPVMEAPESTTLNTKGYFEDYELKEGFTPPWDDFDLIYENGLYYFEFETLLSWDSDDGARNWIVHCLDMMTDYMQRHGYDTTKELDLYEVFTAGANVKSTFTSIEEAYAFLKFTVNGFHGKGMERS